MPQAPIDESAGSNPFAAPESLPTAVSSAWRKHARVAVGLLGATLVSDGFLAGGYTWAAFASAGARVVLFMNATGMLCAGGALWAVGQPHGAREWTATSLVFGGVAAASIPSLVLIDAFFDL